MVLNRISMVLMMGAKLGPCGQFFSKTFLPAKSDLIVIFRSFISLLSSPHPVYDPFDQRRTSDTTVDHLWNPLTDNCQMASLSPEEIQIQALLQGPAANPPPGASSNLEDPPNLGRNGGTDLLHHLLCRYHVGVDHAHIHEGMDHSLSEAF